MATSFMQMLLKACGFGSCQDVRDNMYEYANGNLFGRKLRLLKRHLKVCRKCVRFLMTYVAVKALGKKLPPEYMTDEQKELILEGLNLES